MPRNSLEEQETSMLVCAQREIPVLRFGCNRRHRAPGNAVDIEIGGWSETLDECDCVSFLQQILSIWLV